MRRRPSRRSPRSGCCHPSRRMRSFRPRPRPGRTRAVRRRMRVRGPRRGPVLRVRPGGRGRRRHDRCRHQARRRASGVRRAHAGDLTTASAHPWLNYRPPAGDRGGSRMPARDHRRANEKPPLSGGFRMAGVPGLEPRTKVPETSVLPITPYPKAVGASPCQGSSLRDGSASAKPSESATRRGTSPARTGA